MLSNCGAGEDSWVSWTARRSNQSILKEIRPEYSLEGRMLKLKLQYFGHLMQRVDSLEKTHAGKQWKQENGATEDEMVEGHHWLNRYEFEQVPEDGEGQGSLSAAVLGVIESRHDWITTARGTTELWYLPLLLYPINKRRNNFEVKWKNTKCPHNLF